MWLSWIEKWSREGNEKSELAPENEPTRYELEDGQPAQAEGARQQPDHARVRSEAIRRRRGKRVMSRAGMQSRAVEGVRMLTGKRAAARGGAGDAKEAGTR